VNSADGAFESAKCDVWETSEMSVEDEVFDASVKFGSYVDLLFRDDRRFSFEACERWAREFVVAAKRAPQAHASAELLIRRCFFPERSGFYFTLYVFGFGNAAPTARQRWVEALQEILRCLLIT
jgi:hypothetical protein